MSVPSILQNKPLLHPTDMNIQSEILFPIQFNQRSTRFVFDNKGVLDSNSRINLAITIDETPAQDFDAGETLVMDGASVAVPTSDYAQFNTTAVEYVLGAGDIAATGGSTTTAVIAVADMTELVTAGLVIGDQIYNVTAGVTEISTITILDATTATFAPALTAIVATNVLKVFSRTKYSITIDANTSNTNPSDVADYYVGQKVRLGLNDDGNTALLSTGIVQADIIKYTSSDAEGSIITIDPATLFLASDGTTVLGGVQKKLTLTGTHGLNKHGSIYNPFSVVLTLQDKTDGFWDGYLLTASLNVSPDEVPVRVRKYFQSSATALAQGPKDGIKVINPPNETAYLIRTSEDFTDGWVLQLGTGGESDITMTLTAQHTRGMLPISTGVSSLIRRAVLTIGGREVSSLDAVGHFNTITNMLNSTEYRQKMLFHLEGVNDGMTFRDSALGTDGFIGLVDGHVVDEEIISIPQALEIRNTLATTPRFSIPLSNLIPMMKGVKLPLFAINQEVALLIEWANDRDGHRIISHRPQGHLYTPTTISQAECYMMCDYLYYDAEMLAIMKDIERNDWTLPYEDVITIDAQLSAIVAPTGATPNDFTRTETSTLLYLGGKTVRSIIVQKQSDNPTYTNIGNNKLEGIYNSRSFQRGETYNLLVDNNPFYDTDLALNGLHYQELSRCFDTHLQIPNARYSMADMVDATFDFDRDTADGYITDRRFGGVEVGVNVPQSRALTGNQNYFGINLGNAGGVGVRISNLPLIFRHTLERKATNEEYSDSILYKFYATVKRGMAVRAGGMVVVSD